MNDKLNFNRKKILFKPKHVNQSSSVGYHIKIPFLETPNASESPKITLISKIFDEWDPFVKPKRCMICWKDIGIDDPVMKCPHCKQKGHQVHVARWLAKKNFCPYCREKWK